MRLDVREDYSQDLDKAQLILNCEVFLDGVKVQAIMADEEKGEVEVFIPREDPRWQTAEVIGRWNWPTEIKKGVVEIRPL